MSYVASQAKAHAVKPPHQAPRPQPVAERAPQPFDSLIDHGAPAPAPAAKSQPAKSEAADNPKAADNAPKAKAGPADKPAERKATAEGNETGGNSDAQPQDANIGKGVNTDKRIAGKPSALVEAENGKTKSADKKDDDGSKTDAKPADAVTLSANVNAQPQGDKPVVIAAAIAAPMQNGDAAPAPDKASTPIDALNAASGGKTDALAIAKNDGALSMLPLQQADAKDAPKGKAAVAVPHSLTVVTLDAKITDASAKGASKDAPAQQADGDGNAQAAAAKQPDKQPDTRADKQADARARGEVQADSRRAAPAEARDTTTATPATNTSPKPRADASQTLVLNTPSHSANAANAGTAPAPHAAPAAPQPAVPLAGLAVAIAARALPGKNHFEIRLDPPELGRIEVRLDVGRDGRVTSHLIADRPDTLNLLQRDASDLQRALQDAGLKTGDNGLQFSLRDQSGNTQQNANAPSSTVRLVVDDEAFIPAPQGNSTQLARLRGGLDIRV